MKKENSLILHYLLSSAESDSILSDINEITENKNMMDFLLKKNILLEVSKTENNLDLTLLELVQNRQHAFKLNFNLDGKKLNKKIRKKIQNDLITAEEVPFYLIKQIKKKLNKDYTICAIETDTDVRYFSVLKKKHLKKLMIQEVTIGVFTKIKDLYPCNLA